MKLKHIFLLLTAFAMFSCTQEQLEPAEAAMPAELLQKMQTHTVIDTSIDTETEAFKTPAIKCLDGSCSYAISKFKATNQDLANSTCSTIWGESKCCINDHEVYIIILVRPSSPNCQTMMTKYRYAVTDI